MEASTILHVTTLCSTNVVACTLRSCKPAGAGSRNEWDENSGRPVTDYHHPPQDRPLSQEYAASMPRAVKLSSLCPLPLAPRVPLTPPPPYIIPYTQLTVAFGAQYPPRPAASLPTWCKLGLVARHISSGDDMSLYRLYFTPFKQHRHPSMAYATAIDRSPCHPALLSETLQGSMGASERRGGSRGPSVCC
jgi:hypothetical protein